MLWAFLPNNFTEDDSAMENNVTAISGQDGDQPTTQNTGGVAGERLKSFIERIERLETEKKVIAEDIKEVYGEAKATGFEPKIMRKIISFRKIELNKRREENELLELYMSAIGMAE